MPTWSVGTQRLLRGLGALNWLQMPCPWECGAHRHARGRRPPDMPGPGGHRPSDPGPRQGRICRGRICVTAVSSEVSREAALACVYVCAGGAVRAEPHPPEGRRPGERPPRGCFPPRCGGEAGSGAATARATSGSWSLRDQGWVHHPLPGTTVCRAAPECQWAPRLWPLLKVEAPGWDQVYTRGLSPNGTPHLAENRPGSGLGRQLRRVAS